MAITVADVRTELNTIIGDSSTDRITEAERIQFIDQAVTWVQQQTLNDHQVRTFDMEYFGGLSYYKLNNSITDILEGNDLRRAVGKNNTVFSRKSSSEITEDLADASTENTFSLERRDGNIYLVINHDSPYSPLVASDTSSLTNDGLWYADTTTSDATNLTIDEYDYTAGTGSFRFDIDVSQSVNNRATIENVTMTSEDLQDERDLSSWLVDVKIPDVTYITSVTFYWGSSTGNYYSVTQTADVLGNSFVDNEWMTLKFDWVNSTITGIPDYENVNYIRMDINYSASQADMTSVRVANVRLQRPEPITFYYTSWNVGTDASGNQIKKFTSLTDIPYFSGQYDKYLYAVSHKAASLAYRSLRLYAESQMEEQEALTSLKAIDNIIPKSLTRETKAFKVRGVGFGFRARGMLSKRIRL